MVKHNRVYAYQFNDYWQDIGTPEAYHRANLDSLYTNSILKINSEWPLYSACKRMYQPLVNKGKIVVSNNNIISPGCVIKGTVKNSVLSPGVWVGEDAVIQNSVIMPDASIGRGARVINSILDEGAAIGEYCKIGKMSVDHSSVTVVGQNIRVPSFSEVLTGGDRILNPEPVVFPSFELENILQRKFDSALT
jgi:glucose-1-phosphate adenylyltransferase